MVASIRMPAPRAVAMILTSSSGMAAIEAKDRNRIRAAQVTRRPTRPRPWTMAVPVEPGGVVLLAHAGQQEDLVVHGQAVEEGEGHQRHPHGDGAGGRDAPDGLRAVALLPHQHQHPVGGADRQQVEHDRLEGQQQRAERPGQQHEGDHGDSGQHAAGSCRRGWRWRRWPGRRCPRPARRAARRRPGRGRARRSPRPSSALVSATGRTLTSPVPSRCQAGPAGATASCTPATPSRRSAAARRSVPAGTSTSMGLRTPLPTPARSSRSRASRAGPDWARTAAGGSPRRSPSAATQSGTSTASAARVASQRWRATPAAQPVQRRLAALPRRAGSRRARRLAGQSSRGPTVASSTGSRVRVARVAASGMSRPASRCCAGTAPAAGPGPAAPRRRCRRWSPPPGRRWPWPGGRPARGRDRAAAPPASGSPPAASSRRPPRGRSGRPGTGR